MFSLDLKGILRCIHSSDEGSLLIGHTDVLARTEEHGGQIEVSYLVYSALPRFLFSFELQILLKQE